MCFELKDIWVETSDKLSYLLNICMWINCKLPVYVFKIFTASKLLWVKDFLKVIELPITGEKTPYELTYCL